MRCSFYSVNLAWVTLGKPGCVHCLAWHVYKQASIWTFKLASRYFLAPLFHELYPNKGFYDHPKLKEITHMLSLVRLTYPLWQGELKAAREIPELPTKDKLHLMNLYQLAEFVIPKVSLS